MQQEAQGSNPPTHQRGRGQWRQRLSSTSLQRSHRQVMSVLHALMVSVAPWQHLGRYLLTCPSNAEQGEPRRSCALPCLRGSKPERFTKSCVLALGVKHGQVYKRQHPLPATHQFGEQISDLPVPLELCEQNRSVPAPVPVTQQCCPLEPPSYAVCPWVSYLHYCTSKIPVPDLRHLCND